MKNLFFYLIGSVIPTTSLGNILRVYMLRVAGMKIGVKTKIWGPLIVRPIGFIHKIKIGDNTFVNSEVRFACRGGISIGNNCAIGPRVSFETINHDIHFNKDTKRKSYPLQIIIHDEVWISSGAIILPGVIIGKGAVVAAGAVVTKDVLEYTMVGGVPARVIKKL